MIEVDIVPFWQGHGVQFDPGRIEDREFMAANGLLSRVQRRLGVGASQDKQPLMSFLYLRFEDAPLAHP